MPEQGRLGDKSAVPDDQHGCPGCPHPCVGPAVAGSPDVLVNGKPALRVGDPGIHAACCGPNTWKAEAGSRSVFFNDRRAHRKGDADTHCGGDGVLIQGSPNVFVGDYGYARPPKPKELYDQGFVVIHEPSGFPLANVPYTIQTAAGVVSGTTDAEGRTKRVLTEDPENLQVEVRG